jgi:hypothetical protein
MKREKWIERLLTAGELLTFRPRNKITNTHDILLDVKLVDARAIAAPRNEIRRKAG